MFQPAARALSARSIARLAGISATASMEGKRGRAPLRATQCQARGLPRTLTRHSRRVLRSFVAGSIGVPECSVWVVS